MMKSLVLIPILAALAGRPAVRASCESLKSLALPRTTLTIVEDRAPGPFTAPGAARPTPDLPAFCRVAGTIKPTSDSDIRFEVWLPAPAAWNNRFQGYGNGGFAGDIGYAGLADAVSQHYATASTDTGHQATPGAPPDARWALDHPEKVVDFGYRAIHETAVTAKKLIEAYYGNGPKYSYFNSCSNGGRQGLMEAQRYPGDYDGIVAGAPANFWTRLVTAGGQIKSLFGNEAAYISKAKLPAIQAAALAQCDGSDGVKDGVIENPPACPFDTSVLLCKGPESDSCLTAPQLNALNAIYNGIGDPRGPRLFPGLAPGGEAIAGGWAAWVTGDGPGSSRTDYSTEFFRYMVYHDPAWTAAKFDLTRDLAAAEDQLALTLNANNPDLSAFHKRGGRLILYHGWVDPAIPPANSIDYFNRASSTLGAAAQDTLRLYMVPGMGHCGGGNGPNQFGALSVPHADPKHDLEAALEAWVEKSEAPAAIVAAKMERGKVTRTRPLCPWPAVARWDGKGNPDEAASFSCVKP